MGSKMTKSVKTALFATTSALFLGLGACSTSMPVDPPMNLKNRIQIAETVERLELYARPDGLSLSARDEMAVANFLKAYAAQGDGPLFVNVPALKRPSAGIAQTQDLIKGMMASTGLGYLPVETGQYNTPMGASAPVVVSYKVLKTVVPDCRWLGNLTSTGNNQTYAGFGCSTSANMAAMISDPRQFIEPYPMISPDMERRSVVYDRYIEGQDPSSAQPSRQAVSASE